MQSELSDGEMNIIRQRQRIKWTQSNNEELYRKYFTPLLNPKVIAYLNSIYG